jgi:site-specific DNA recombinase
MCANDHTAGETALGQSRKAATPVAETTMAVGIYLRVSTEEQRERQSIMTQREFGERYCQLHGLPIHAMYADDGVSGTIPLEGRTAGRAVLEDARQRKFDQLLVFKLDRLGRETRLILNSVAELEKYGVRIRSMTEEFDTATATGRLMLTMLSGFAAHERELIRERSIAGSNRIAETGAWMGGIVPYGYRKQGERGHAGLVICEEPIAGFDFSEAEVVRTIYRMSAEEKQSCMTIADYLSRTGVPCASAGNAPGVRAGKRSKHNSGIWRPSHVRNMIVSQTYMGRHVFGKRSTNPNRKLIVRETPAIVSEQTWEAAQQVLKSNRIVCKRNSHRPYLLRGLIKCGFCGLTFSGLTMRAPQKDHYYRCNGRQFARGLYGNVGKKCPAKMINGDYIERIVWADIEAFLRNPGEILERLRERLAMSGDEQQRREKELQRLNALLEQKTGERERMLALFRRGRIDDATLDQHLDEIETETADLNIAIERETRALSAGDRTQQLTSAETLLMQLRKRLKGAISPELKRRIIEVLVESVQADTVECWGVQQTKIMVTYRFAQPEEAAAIVLPKSHHLTSRTRPPEKLDTVGDHIRRRRILLKLLQRQVGQQFGVDASTIHNWETNLAKPGIKYMPAIIRFLGYNPLPPPSDSWDERLVRCRTALGITQKESARQIGVDQGTLARWERGERVPAGAFATKATAFLNSSESASANELVRIA